MTCPQSNLLWTVLKQRKRKKDLPSCAHVPEKTFNLVISRCWALSSQQKLPVLIFENFTVEWNSHLGGFFPWLDSTYYRFVTWCTRVTVVLPLWQRLCDSDTVGPCLNKYLCSSCVQTAGKYSRKYSSKTTILHIFCSSLLLSWIGIRGWAKVRVSSTHDTLINDKHWPEVAMLSSSKMLWCAGTGGKLESEIHEWNANFSKIPKFSLFGQTEKVVLNFRKSFPEKILFHWIFTRNFRNFRWMESTRCFAENEKEMNQNVNAPSELLFLLIKAIVLWRSRRRCRPCCLNSLIGHGARARSCTRALNRARAHVCTRF